MFYQETFVLCQAQYVRYPQLTVQDLVKALYQSEFGCGHLISDPEAGLKRLIAEAQACADRKDLASPPLIETLGLDFCRIHLRALAQAGLSTNTLFRLFELSAEKPAGDMGAFLEKLSALEKLIADGVIPLDADKSRQFLRAYLAAGCPAVHHSHAFAKAYAPAYRVVRAAYCPWLGVLAAIDHLMAQGKPVTVAIEGGSASGKTSLAAFLETVYPCNVFHMDDFFLQPHQRTPQRYAEPGGNVDYERFKTEVLDAIARGEPFSYRLFDCRTMQLGETVHVQPKPLSIVEGVYSLHPSFSSAYDYAIFLDVDENTQAERILRRNGSQMQKRFLSEWIPLEKLYFDHTRTAERCSIVIPSCLPDP